ncbi:hypothetical protein B0H12DRAFT_120967 [Mycena haematopus]|nr:hypothetical protein B0H12DRAFT_120967 [Mycena haematopus]
MAVTIFSMRAIVLQQKERTRKSSKADVEGFIEESELKITSLESQISTLIELRDRERACISALRHLFSSIHTLPVELLAEIFELTIGVHTHIEDAFRISQVCSDWRQVAHSTPRLWARPIWISFRPGDRHHAYTDGLKAWLVRSAPLTIPVSLVLEHCRKDDRIPDEILKTAPRWHSLTLTHVHPLDDASSSLISQLAECKLESLEELSLGSFAENVDLTALPSFTTIPQLRALSIHLSSNALPILVPWAQLIDLTLDTDFVTIALDVLGQCTNLITANVSTAGWSVLPEAGQDIVPLNHLHFLTLDFFGLAGHVTPFLERLSTPVLDNLCLDFEMIAIGNEVWTQTSFTTFQLRAPNITHLEFRYSCLTSDDLRTAIRHAPSLTHLKLNNCPACFDDALIDALCYKAGVTPLVPHLHYLRLEDIGDNFTKDTLVGMIASRWWTDAELASRWIPPAVARWTRIQLWGDFAQHVIDIVKNMSSDIPIGYC